MNLDNNAHSVFLLNYHLVLVIKYRRVHHEPKKSARYRTYTSMLPVKKM